MPPFWHSHIMMAASISDVSPYAVLHAHICSGSSACISMTMPGLSMMCASCEQAPSAAQHRHCPPSQQRLWAWPQRMRAAWELLLTRTPCWQPPWRRKLPSLLRLLR